MKESPEIEQVKNNLYMADILRLGAVHKKRLRKKLKELREKEADDEQKRGC
jgi:hypothetical protein